MGRAGPPSGTHRAGWGLRHGAGRTPRLAATGQAGALAGAAGPRLAHRARLGLRMGGQDYAPSGTTARLGLRHGAGRTRRLHHRARRGLWRMGGQDPRLQGGGSAWGRGEAGSGFGMGAADPPLHHRARPGASAWGGQDPRLGTTRHHRLGLPGARLGVRHGAGAGPPVWAGPQGQAGGFGMGRAGPRRWHHRAGLGASAWAARTGAPSGHR
ncbi:hornerin-like [Pomacea canaliculata]|uniref:hornerin-like n=1 Tax=Pomacea canaliculata TaxID=400727 RepID=UPI000D739F25|nr:hornerin-like [Pomacea canaliculata]